MKRKEKSGESFVVEKMGKHILNLTKSDIEIIQSRFDDIRLSFASPNITNSTE